MTYFLSFILFSIGIYCILTKRNILKIIIGIAILDYAINLFFILIAYRTNGRSPILEKGSTIKRIVDPLPHAVVLTSIVIGLAVTALLVAIAIRIYEKYGTFDINEIKELKG